MSARMNALHRAIQAVIIAINVVLWPYDLRYRHPLELNRVLGIAIGLFVGYGLARLYAMAFIDGGEKTVERLRASRGKAALVAAWSVGILAAVVLMLGRSFLPQPIPEFFRDLPAEELLAMDLSSYAEQAFRKQLKTAKPDDPAPWYGLAQAQLKQGKLEEAESSARRGLAIAPGADEGTSCLAQVLLAAARPKEALEAIRDGLTRNPGSVVLKQIEATALIQAGDLPAAERIYAGLAAKQPDNPVWYAQRATALFGLDKFAESRNILDEAIIKARRLVELNRDQMPKLQEVMSICSPVEKALTQKGFPTTVPPWAPDRDTPPMAPRPGPPAPGPVPHGPDHGPRAPSPE